MKEQFLVEIVTRVFIPVTVDATSDSEARELALANKGEFGERSYSDPVIIRCQKLADNRLQSR